MERNVYRKRSATNVAKLAQALKVDTTELFVGTDSLIDCQKQYSEWENNQPGDSVLVRCIGLDMANGWEAVVRSINSTAARSICLEILVVHRLDNGLSDHHPIFQMWTNQAEANIELIKQSISQWNPKTKELIHISFKGYSELPSQHGIYAEKSGSIRMWITECKEILGPEATGYSWGEDFYRAIQDPGPEDIRAKEFNARFKRLWSQSRHLLIGEKITRFDAS